MAKVSHKEAGYHEGHGPTGSHCSICRYFTKPGPHCLKVVDPIGADDGCELFAPAEKKTGLGDLLAEQRDAKLPKRPITPRAQTSSVPTGKEVIAGGGKGSPERHTLEAIEVDDVKTTKKSQGGHWGYHLLIDMSDCNANINSDKVIGQFLDDLVTRLKMKKLAEPEFYDVSGVDGRGVSAFQVITTSHISIHTDDDKMSAYCDVFSCAPYDPDTAIGCVRKYFAPKHLGLLWLYRDADE